MKKILLLSLLLVGLTSFGQEQTGSFSFSPTNFGINDEVTITVSGVDPEIWNTGEPNNIFLWAWYFDGCGNTVGGPLIGNGSWDNSNDDLQLTNNGDGTYSFVMTPSIFFGISKMSGFGVLVKADNGNGDKKTQDHIEYLGQGIHVNIANPASTVVLNSGDNLTIGGSVFSKGAQIVNVPYEIFFNEVSQVSGTTGFPNFSNTLTNITTSGTVRVEATYLGDSNSCSVEVIVAPTVTDQNIPAGLKEGINYNDSDDTKATLVLNAPLKDFVYVAGSFNNYNPGASYLMKKDPSTGIFWLELTGLISGQVETYQYWVYDTNPVANSPNIVKTADPFSTLVLSPFDDWSIPSTSFPGLGTTYEYPSGQEREVTVIQTGQIPYIWQETNFNKPKKEDLIIYEVLIRDFDSDKNFQDLIDRISYFKNLGINAIELMPVMEFEGNESWGYNTAFHMALDKFYGTAEKFKELIDTCHQNGIAVILDIAFNHAYGRNPLVRMWMDDADNTGWGAPSSENPFFNQTAKHSYSVGSDFNHSQTITQDYVKRVVEYWIEEFKIDGFRWDLTKGFTQNCESDEACTNDYNQDRVDILKDYADHSWSLDPDHYVIFEHLGTNGFGDQNSDGKTSVDEDIEWANYRIGEGKGIMMWSEQWHPYKELANGKSTGIDISGIGHIGKGFDGKRVVGYPESHDKDRIMYEMFTYGESGIQGNLNNSLKRMSAIGAVFITVPGPKMMWHFAELGMDDSIWTCSNGTVNSDYDGNNDGDCKLDTKPQPQWAENWLSDPNRSQVHSDWTRMIKLKINEPVFEGDYNITSSTQTPRISIYTGDENTSGVNLKNVIVIANFSTSSQNVNPNFPYGGTWYDLMDESGSTTISGSTTSVNLTAGEFKMYGNQSASLSTEDKIFETGLMVYPNPSRNSFRINKNIETVSIYNLTGKQVKSFRGNFDKGHSFDISNLPQSIYIVKINSKLGVQETLKVVKL
ncbi:alpha-amylase family glycosyl hydrolase [Seonamhaeicola maritimus]|uniref:T9SS type A sorting domain-containing protein n=1 Tax=Seonamhaeicola maritimus TaxID=2591822 RepID=A0A5C7GGQ3_9FLAO|nr:alpha-amylase family glycosyl hydrolase [Seonamhaeicola maritimus]TXG36653.1 T9SS type A sorting domain-containing protein [Seonamhaeicola maritimus]